jgi:hypothetical protein
MSGARLVADDGRTVSEQCAVADTVFTRMRGLLGRRTLPPGEGVLLRPAPSVHTCFMRFPIDVVFLDRRFNVVGVRHDVRPWRLVWCRGAHMALELAAGEAARRGIQVGERIALAAPRAGINIVIAAADVPFVTVSSYLLEEAGFDVWTTRDRGAVCDLVERRRAHVVVVDATGAARETASSMAELEARHPEVGVVVVSDGPAPAHFRAVPKWSGFEDLREQIERAAVAVG